VKAEKIGLGNFISRIWGSIISTCDSVRPKTDCNAPYLSNAKFLSLMLMLPRHLPRPALPVSLAPRVPSRSYGLSVEPPLEFPKYKGKTRFFGERKTHLYHQYLKILESSAEKPIIFLHHNDFTVQRLIKLRRDVTAAYVSSLASPSPTPASDAPIITIVRSAVFGAALRDFSPIHIDAGRKIANFVLKGGLAVLTLPSFDPPQLDAILRIMDRTVPPRTPLTQAQLDEIEAEKKADPVMPGRAPQKVKRPPQPELKLLGALIERQAFSAPEIQDVSKLPTMATLRAQVVGMLSSPAIQLAAVLGEASGGKLARTLEGLKKSLEEGRDVQS
jgi:ribosomal protein L10